MATTPVTDSPFAANLRAALAESAMTQEGLARAIDSSNRSVAGWCLGERVPRWGHVVKLAAVLGKTPGWFYADHDGKAA